MKQFEEKFILEHLETYCSCSGNDNLQNLIEEKSAILRKMNISHTDFGSKKGCIDLHIHTNLSDGLFSPEDIFLAARYLGLEVISITDHASISSYLRNPWLCKSNDCIVLPGIEIHSLYKNATYHILLFGEQILSQDFAEHISRWQKKWNLRFRDICDTLSKKRGLFIDFDDVYAKANRETLDICNIANAISEKIGKPLDFVMDNYFGKKSVQRDSAYIHASHERYLPTFFEIAGLAKQYGLHCVLAHPTKKQIEASELQSMIQSGLTGLEVYHPTISNDFRALLISIAKKHKLKMFGGSDFHSPDKHLIQFGFRSDRDPSVRVPFAIYANSILNEPHIIIEGPLTLSKLSLEEKVGLILRPSFELMAFDALSKRVIRQYSCTNCRIEKSLINTSAKMVDYVRSCINANTHPILINVNQEGGRLNTIDWFENIFISSTSVAKLSKDKRLKHFSLLSKELKLLGITWNLAPVCDLRKKNVSAIGNRSFGEDLDRVCQCVIEFIQASKENTIATTLKHFPGTGSCNEDCHWCFPYLSKIESKHLAPFLFGMIHGADTIMISNAIINNIERIPALLSSKVIDNLLINGLGADQVIITDNISMQAMIDLYEDMTEIALSAFAAGSDFIMLNPDFSRGKSTTSSRISSIVEESRKRNAAFLKLLNSVETGLLDEDRIDNSVQKIISFYNKYAVSSVDANWENELCELQIQKNIFLTECAKQLVCVERDKNGILPLKALRPCILVFIPGKGAKADSSWHRNVYIPEALRHNVFYVNELTNNLNELIPSNRYDVIVYIAYNINVYPTQKKHIQSLKDPYVIIGTGDDDKAIEELDASCYISAKERTDSFLKEAFSILLGI